MTVRILALSVLVTVLAANAHAQSFNIDFGPSGGASGVPSNGYSALGEPGVWQAVDQAVTHNLVDVTGSVTGVSLDVSATPSYFADCDHPGTQGEEEALLDDRLVFQFLESWIKVFGLEPARYLVYVYGIEVDPSPCPNYCFLGFMVCDTKYVNCQTLGGDWSGMLVYGESFTVHEVDLSGAVGSGDLSFWVGDTNLGCFAQVSGLQIVKLEGTSPFCFGDGTGIPCPCGNPGQPATGCANSSGLGGWIEASGSTSVTVDDLRFTAHELLTGQPALLFAGLNQLGGGFGLPFGDGLRCVGDGVVRLGTSVPDGSGLAFWGDGLAPLGGWAPGDERQFQVWYRDPGGSCLSGFNLTQALQAHFVP